MSNILVTGATGFLGGAVARRLAADGRAMVIATGRNRARGKALEEECENVRFLGGNLEDREFVAGLCEGVDRVFHCGALSSPWGSRKAFESANVTGTANVIESCRKHKVGRLIYISSPSVYPQDGDSLLVKEDTSITGTPLNDYILTKRKAEVLIVEAASEEANPLKVITIRPRALFGPGDETLFPRILRAGRKGRFPLIGSDDPWMDCTYIDNAVDALLLASKAPESCEGKIYNISNGEPMRRSELFSTLFAEVGLPYNPRVIPMAVAKGLACMLELGSRCFTGGRYEPVLTRYTVRVLALSQTLDISAAQADLGFAPKVTVRDGLKKFGKWWQNQEGQGT